MYLLGQNHAQGVGMMALHFVMCNQGMEHNWSCSSALLGKHFLHSAPEASWLPLQFAGNVLVYGAVSPSDGDWYGGLNASNAEHFLDALLGLQVTCLCLFFVSKLQHPT